MGCQPTHWNVIELGVFLVATISQAVLDLGSNDLTRSKLILRRKAQTKSPTLEGVFQANGFLHFANYLLLLCDKFRHDLLFLVKPLLGDLGDSANSYPRKMAMRMKVRVEALCVEHLSI